MTMRSFVGTPAPASSCATIYPREMMRRSTCRWNDRAALRLSLINADPIDAHGLRKDCGLIWVARPSAADGEVENDEEGLVKFVHRRPARGVDASAEILNAVEFPNDAAGAPFHFEDMIILIEELRIGQLVRAAVLLSEL